MPKASAAAATSATIKVRLWGNEKSERQQKALARLIVRNAGLPPSTDGTFEHVGTDVLKAYVEKESKRGGVDGG